MRKKIIGVTVGTTMNPKRLEKYVDEAVGKIKPNHIETDETLSYEGGVLSVNRAHEPDPDNTLPITAAAVANTIGNIEILLKTI